jgi:hypothetical protein
MPVTRPITLTSDGESWARRNALTSITARIALNPGEWPEQHRAAAVAVCNTQGVKSAKGYS